MQVSASEVKILRESEEGNTGTYSISPLPAGFGNTLGTSLRRVLLSSLPGAAATQVRFSGVSHQFTNIKGVKEDIVEICLNLKKLRLSIQGEGPVVLKLSSNGAGEVTAGDFEAPSEAKVINEDLHIATLADKATKLEMEVVAETGVGYVPAEEKESSKVGVILLDSVFSPVVSVSYTTEATRVGRETNLDKLTFKITTDGSIAPYDALMQASKILQNFFEKLSQGEDGETSGRVVAGKEEKGSGKMEGVYIEDLPLPTRTINALKKAGVRTLADLSAKMPDELSEIKNLGDKSIDEIKKLMEKEGLA